MIFASGAAAPFRRARPARAAGLAMLLGLGAMLPGCAEPNAATSASLGTMPATAAVRSADPVVAFAAAAPPGTESVVTLPENGRNARIRLVRAYNAASGRECREVILGSGPEERSRTVCNADGEWTAARPLLRGSGMQRP